MCIRDSVFTKSTARWCDIVDDTGLDPLLNFDSWKMPSAHERRTPNDVRIEGRALREAPHISREPDTRAESEFEPIGIDHPNDEVRLRWGGPSRAKLICAGVGGGMDRGDGVKPQEPSLNVIVERESEFEPSGIDHPTKWLGAVGGVLLGPN